MIVRNANLTGDFKLDLGQPGTTHEPGPLKGFSPTGIAGGGRAFASAELKTTSPKRRESSEAAADPVDKGRLPPWIARPTANRRSPPVTAAMLPCTRVECSRGYRS